MPRDDDRIWQWGKNKGTPLQDLSTNYLQWAVANFTYDKAVKIAEAELKYRNADVPAERNVETAEMKMIGKIQWELKKTTTNLVNLTEGLNRLLVASGLQSVTLEPEVKSDYDEKKKSGPYKAEVVDDPFDEFESAF